ncbi:hypothetical protein Taro_047171 [Colocasia esculenta]|uniref:Uncharacterized protein n=1 Tax=Colocasia esculenta TaxID=4460 RepID=A0A843X541_COLES|nr:hypothetical protein [Colocasia esculenta]
MWKQTISTHPPRQRSLRDTGATTRDRSLTTQAPTSRTSTRLGRNNQVSPRETPSNHVKSNVPPQTRPPQTSTRSRAHKHNHPAPRTLHEVRETTHSDATTEGTKERSEAVRRTSWSAPNEHHTTSASRTHLRELYKWLTLLPHRFPLRFESATLDLTRARPSPGATPSDIGPRDRGPRAMPRPTTRVGPEQHDVEANRRHTPAETKKLTRHRSNHERPESHDTSTNNPDLHEVGKEQPGVTTRDTEQPCEKQCLTIGTTTSDLHQVEGPQAEPPCTSDTPRGQGNHTLWCHHGWHQGTGY